MLDSSSSEDEDTNAGFGGYNKNPTGSSSSNPRGLPTRTQAYQRGPTSAPPGPTGPEVLSEHQRPANKNVNASAGNTTPYRNVPSNPPISHASGPSEAPYGVSKSCQQDSYDERSSVRRSLRHTTADTRTIPILGAIEHVAPPPPNSLSCLRTQQSISGGVNEEDDLSMSTVSLHSPIAHTPSAHATNAHMSSTYSVASSSSGGGGACIPPASVASGTGQFSNSPRHAQKISTSSSVQSHMQDDLGSTHGQVAPMSKDPAALELEKTEREEQERRRTLQLYVFVMRCIAYPFYSKPPTELVRRYLKITKQQLNVFKERFQAYLSGELDVVGDEAFTNAIQSYYEVFLRSDRVASMVRGGGCSMHDFREVFRLNSEHRVRCLPQIEGLNKSNVVSAWMVKFDQICRGGAGPSTVLQKLQVPQPELVMSKEQLYELFQATLGVKKYEHQILYNALQIVVGQVRNLKHLPANKMVYCTMEVEGGEKLQTDLAEAGKPSWGTQGDFNTSQPLPTVKVKLFTESSGLLSLDSGKELGRVILNPTCTGNRQPEWHKMHTSKGVPNDLAIQLTIRMDKPTNLKYCGYLYTLGRTAFKKWRRHLASIGGKCFFNLVKEGDSVMFATDDTTERQLWVQAVYRATGQTHKPIQPSNECFVATPSNAAIVRSSSRASAGLGARTQGDVDRARKHGLDEFVSVEPWRINHAQLFRLMQSRSLEHRMKDSYVSLGWFSPSQMFILDEYCARYGVRGCHRHLCYLSDLLDRAEHGTMIDPALVHYSYAFCCCHVFGNAQDSSIRTVLHEEREMFLDIRQRLYALLEKQITEFRYYFPFGRPEGALKLTLGLLERVLMKDTGAPASAEEVREVIRRCLEQAALVNYTRISEYAAIEKSMKLGKFHQQLTQIFAPLVVRYVDLMEASIAQSIGVPDSTNSGTDTESPDGSGTASSGFAALSNVGSLVSAATAGVANAATAAGRAGGLMAAATAAANAAGAVASVGPMASFNPMPVTSAELLWKLEALQTFIRELHWPEPVFAEHLDNRLKMMAADMIDAAAQSKVGSATKVAKRPQIRSSLSPMLSHSPAFAWFHDLLTEHAELFWNFFAADMTGVLETMPPDCWDSFPLFQLLNDYLISEESMKLGKFHQQLTQIFAPLVVRYVDLMEASIAQSIGVPDSTNSGTDTESPDGSGTASSGFAALSNVGSLVSAATAGVANAATAAGRAGGLMAAATAAANAAGAVASVGPMASFNPMPVTSAELLWKLEALQTFIRELHWPEPVFAEHLDNRLKMMAADMIDAAAQSKVGSATKVAKRPQIRSSLSPMLSHSPVISRLPNS
ncbi:hypothetical protein AHF37_02619 [Paragonimus kellicotti]|nr:hypothetical protein AHF37_02619 [Paragonimus kellicotti]